MQQKKVEAKLSLCLIKHRPHRRRTRYGLKHFQLQHYVNSSGQLQAQTALPSGRIPGSSKTWSWMGPRIGVAEVAGRTILDAAGNLCSPTPQAVTIWTELCRLSDSSPTASTWSQGVVQRLEVSYWTEINIILYKWGIFYLKYTENLTRFNKPVTLTEQLHITRVNGDSIKQSKWNEETDEASFLKERHLIYDINRGERDRETTHAAIYED